MFDIGFQELVLVALVALFVLGPEKMPEAVRTVALMIGRLKRTFNALKTEIEKEVGADEIRRQLRNEEIMERFKQTQEQIQSTVDSVKNTVEDIQKSADAEAQAVADLENHGSTSETPADAPAAETPAIANATTETTAPTPEPVAPAAVESTAEKSAS